MEAIVTIIVIIFVVISGVVNARNKRKASDETDYPDDIDAVEQLKRVFTVQPPAAETASADDDDETREKNTFEHDARDENVWEAKIAALKKKQAEAEQYALNIHHTASAEPAARAERRQRIDLSPQAVRQGIIYAAIFERKRPSCRARRS